MKAIVPLRRLCTLSTASPLAGVEHVDRDFAAGQLLDPVGEEVMGQR
jgi:hypothetical protein